MPASPPAFASPAARVMPAAPAKRSASPFDLVSELGLADESPVRGFDVDALDEIDLDMLAPEPVRAKPAPAPAAPTGSGSLVPELDGLFVELIEE